MSEKLKSDWLLYGSYRTFLAFYFGLYIQLILRVLRACMRR